jgi:hypothetical protein
VSSVMTYAARALQRFVLFAIAFVAATFAHRAALKFITRLFPTGIFEIGEGSHRHNGLKGVSKGLPVS